MSDGKVVAAEVQGLDGVWAAMEPSSEEPVEALFASLGETTCTVTATYDPEWSYPTEIYFDCRQEGWGVDVTCFAAATQDLEVCR